MVWRFGNKATFAAGLEFLILVKSFLEATNFDQGFRLLVYLSRENLVMGRNCLF